MKDTTFRLRLTSEDKAAIEAAASREGRSASDWALRALLKAVEPGITDAGLDRVLRQPDVIYNPATHPFDEVGGYNAKPVPIVDAPLPRSTPVEAARRDLEQLQQRLGVQPFSKEMQAGRQKKRT